MLCHPIKCSGSGTTSYYAHDALGSIRGLYDGNINALNTYEYNAFGELHSSTESTANDYLFTGQQYDDETGLYFLRARYYDPAIGRFLSQDPYPVNVGNPMELNRYVYTANNPVNMSDPSGLTGLVGQAKLYLNSVVQSQYLPYVAAGVMIVLIVIAAALNVMVENGTNPEDVAEDVGEAVAAGADEALAAAEAGIEEAQRVGEEVGDDLSDLWKDAIETLNMGESIPGMPTGGPIGPFSSLGKTILALGLALAATAAHNISEQIELRIAPKPQLKK